MRLPSEKGKSPYVWIRVSKLASSIFAVWEGFEGQRMQRAPTYLASLVRTTANISTESSSILEEARRHHASGFLARDHSYADFTRVSSASMRRGNSISYTWPEVGVGAESNRFVRYAVRLCQKFCGVLIFLLSESVWRR